MPIYEYACQKCKSNTEIMQKMSDKPLTKCVKCGGKLEKQWSQTSFQLKGSGWYVTDYAKKSGTVKEGKETEAKEEKKEDKKEEKKTASEPATASNGGNKQAKKEEKKPSAPASSSKD
ncbi:MAG: zinc ribbon domain-containing protein [Pyrinomonadaceae bacterium]